MQGLKWRKLAIPATISPRPFGALEKHRIEKANRAGSAVGLSYPPDWGKRTVSLWPSDMSELKPGMTFHFMIGLWMKDWDLECFVITLGGYECLASVPRGLLIRD